MTGYLKPRDIVKLCGGGTQQMNRSMVACPAHKDKTASMRVSKGRKATIVHCHAGCTIKEICAALEIQVAQLYHDYTPNHQGSTGSMTLKRMQQKRTPPTLWEIAPHQSVQDVLYEVLDVSPEVWADVTYRWQDILESGFDGAWSDASFVIVNALCGDLLVEHIDAGWEYTVKRRKLLEDKILDEWEEHGA